MTQTVTRMVILVCPDIGGGVITGEGVAGVSTNDVKTNLI